MAEVNVSQLSDDELADMLQRNGFVCGPIVESTRSVYQRKLERILSGEELAFSEGEEEEGRQQSSSGMNRSPSPGSNRSPSPGSNRSPSPGINLSSMSSSSFRYDELKRRPLTRTQNSSWHSDSFGFTSASDIVSQVEESPSDAKDSRLSFTVTVALFAFAIVFIFLIYQNMESGVVNPVPPDFKG